MGDYGSSSENDNASTLFGRTKALFSAKTANTELNIVEAIRSIYPDKHVTPVHKGFANLTEFAQAGHATATLRRDGNEYLHNRQYIPPASRMESGDGKLVESVKLGLYDYTHQDQTCLVYYAEWSSSCGTTMMYFVLTPASAASAECSEQADNLIKAAGKWSSQLHEEVYVFDSGRWMKDHKLWEAVQNSYWDDVILDPAMKDTLINDVENFFDSRAVYEEYSVPWKRGIILHGTPGCGKTISIKALMNSLQKRNVASMYVKSFEAQDGQQFSIRQIFRQARIMAPCMLIFEDLDSLVVDKVRSYFLNEVDGLEDNDGILMIGSTNHLERLDPGIAKRPSRFDRKYHYKLPGERERILYCEYWRKKLQKNSSVNFDQEICNVVAQLTEGFSFAYMKELFVQTLLAIVGGRADIEDDDEEDFYDHAKEAAKETKIAEGSGSLLKSDETVETTTVISEAAESKPQHTMPDATIPEHLQPNSLMRILHKQTKALWQEMDNTADEIHRRTKVGGSGDKRSAIKARMAAKRR
ncbi:uncharacterized protein CLAFUR5_13631 [Fulvia fulva]|uniref:AAA+ ATPase domain-containing protein n=1 Tax=Passalora fulva TaxID=5499 RepID=A0A9Q8PLJ2_PASFU|nr:uncharacterized protein CLAFUR5_13631 [Fulvia fulva]UJO24658.1 hypothetical protein CLAFUR5_13631 [Fulvia fulva]WPV36988.1 hypothetical protein CLAFUW7_13793 [Fulvia fulva]